MTTVWSENLALTSAVLLVTDANTVGERAEVEQKLMDGYLPVSVCGYQRRVGFLNKVGILKDEYAVEMLRRL
jgi:hypothetical protein